MGATDLPQILESVPGIHVNYSTYGTPIINMRCIGGAGPNSHRLRGLLVTAEVALAMVALIGAGLFFRSFENARDVQSGFDMTNMSMSQFYLSNAGYSAHEQHLFCRKLRERMEAQPGVLGVTYSDVTPLANAGQLDALPSTRGGRLCSGQGRANDSPACDGASRLFQADGHPTAGGP